MNIQIPYEVFQEAVNLANKAGLDGQELSRIDWIPPVLTTSNPTPNPPGTFCLVQKNQENNEK